jgi:NHS family xanthosine MFS transporter
MMMTNGFGASIGTLTAQAVNNACVAGKTGVALQEGWSQFWYIFAAYALVVAVLFAILFRYKHQPAKN